MAEDPLFRKVMSLVAEERSLKPGTADAYASTLRSFSKYMGGVERVLGATASEALEWIESVRDSSNESNAYYHARRASAIFNALVSTRIVEENPFPYVLKATKHYERKPLYEDAVTLPEIKAIIDHAESLALGELSSIGQIKSGVAALLHVKYCIPLSGIASMRMRDYVKTAADSILSWSSIRPAETCLTVLDRTTARCLDRLISYRRDAGPEDPILAQPRGRNRGGFYNAGNIRCIASRVYKEAGVHVGNRNLKVAAARLAAEAGANAAEIKGITSSISSRLAHTVAKEQIRMDAFEIWDRLDMELDRKVPIARGFVSVAKLREAIEAAGDADSIDFAVTASGKLEFPAANDHRED